MTDMTAMLIVALAVYRLSYLIALEEGPFGVAARWREWVEAQHGPLWLNEGVHCPLCISFWLGGLAALYLTIDPALAFIPMRVGIMGLALSAVTVVLQRIGR